MKPASLRVAELVACRTDSFVRLLGVFHPLVVPARAGAAGSASPYKLGYHPAGRRQRLVRKRRAVGAHVGDVARLVEVLSHSHGTRGRKAQLTTGLLLEGRGQEGRVRRAPPRFLLDAAHREIGALEPLDEATSAGLVEAHDVAPG